MTIHHRRAVWALLLTTAFWAVSFPFMKALIQEEKRLVPEATSWFCSAWILGSRFTLGAFLLLPWMLVRRTWPNHREIRQGLVLAFWGGAGMWLQADGLAHTEASISAFLTQGYCVFLPLWAALRDRRRPGLRTIGATLMVMAGVAWLAGVDWSSLRMGRGEAETLVAAFLFTFQILALEDPRYDGNHGGRVSFVMFSAVGLLYLVVAAIASPAIPALWRAGASPQAAGMISVIAVCCTLGAFLLMNLWQRHVTATEAGLIYACEPLFTAVYVLFMPGWLGAWTGNPYPNEMWTVSLIGGGGLITAANAWMQLGAGKK